MPNPTTKQLQWDIDVNKLAAGRSPLLQRIVNTIDHNPGNIPEEDLLRFKRNLMLAQAGMEKIDAE